MSANNESNSESSFRLVKMPAHSEIVIEVAAKSIEEVHSWAHDNLKGNERWIIQQHGRNVGEALRFVRYTFDCDEQRVTKRVFNSRAPRARYFETEQLARADYQAHLAKSDELLDAIASRLNTLQAEMNFELDYCMRGDTHGIYEDYQFVSVNVGGYRYRRQI